MEKMREEFEEWFWDYHHKDCSIDYWSVIFAIGCDGKYQGIACEGAWNGWKASRGALCVELPTKMRDEVLSLYDIGFNDGIDGAMECIEDAGVSYK